MTRVQLLPRWRSDVRWLPMRQRPKMVPPPLECIYMAQMDYELRPHRIKAGCSRNLPSRLSQYLTSSPQAQFLAIAQVSVKAEAELLTRLEAIAQTKFNEVFDIEDVDCALLIFDDVARKWKDRASEPDDPFLMAPRLLDCRALAALI